MDNPYSSTSMPLLYGQFLPNPYVYIPVKGKGRELFPWVVVLLCISDIKMSKCTANTVSSEFTSQVAQPAYSNSTRVLGNCVSSLIIALTCAYIFLETSKTYVQHKSSYISSKHVFLYLYKCWVWLTSLSSRRKWIPWQMCLQSALISNESHLQIIKRNYHLSIVAAKQKK